MEMNTAHEHGFGFPRSPSGSSNWVGGEGVIATNMSARITVRSKSQPSVAVHRSLSDDNNNNGSNPDGLRPRPATATATGSGGSRATKWDRSVFYLASFSFSLHAIIDLTPHRPPTPRSACTNNPERLFSHAYSLPGPLRGAASTPLASIPNAILTFPQQSRTALRDYVERNPHAQGTTLYFLSPLDPCCMQCMVKPLQLRRNFSIAPTQRPRAESSFFHTGTALHVYKHGYEGPNPWSNLIK
jgi:hypothetical protein